MQKKIGLKIGAIANTKIIDPEKIHTLLEPGELGAMIDLKVWDPKTGNVTEERSKKSESFLQGFLQMLYIMMAGIAGQAAGPRAESVAGVSIRDTGNTLRTIFIAQQTDPWHLDVLAGATVVTFGIIIGTGNTAPVISNYVIETIIPHATMNYSAVTFGAPASDATTSQLTITRNFANVSGGGVTVNEVGLYSRAWYASATAYIMLIRDVIAGGILVPNGQTLTVNYRAQAVV